MLGFWDYTSGATSATPASLGDTSKDTSDRSALDDVARAVQAPIIWIGDSPATGISLLLGLLAVIAVGLLGISSLPPKLVSWTPVPVHRFVSSRSYVGIAGLSLLIGVLLAFALGGVRP